MLVGLLFLLVKDHFRRELGMPKEEFWTLKGTPQPPGASRYYWIGFAFYVFSSALHAGSELFRAIFLVLGAVSLWFMYREWRAYLRHLSNLQNPR